MWILRVRLSGFVGVLVKECILKRPGDRTKYILTGFHSIDLYNENMKVSALIVARQTGRVVWGNDDDIAT